MFGFSGCFIFAVESQKQIPEGCECLGDVSALLPERNAVLAFIAVSVRDNMDTAIYIFHLQK